MSKTTFTYGLTSTKGSQRKVNEDSAIALTWSDVPRFSGQSVGLFIVADGMGGELGVKASQLAIQIMAEEITADIFKTSDLSISQIMTAAVQKANRQVVADCSDGGSTLTAALLIGNQLYIAHVGDSHAYYAYGKDLTQLTTNHTLLQRYIDLKHFTWDEIKTGNIGIGKQLYRALGQSENLEVDILTERLELGSYLLLSTDGLGWYWNNNEQMEVLSITQNNPPQLACDNLIDFAQKGGSGDDISVIVVKLSEE